MHHDPAYILWTSVDIMTLSTSSTEHVKFLMLIGAPPIDALGDLPRQRYFEKDQRETIQSDDQPRDFGVRFFQTNC